MDHLCQSHPPKCTNCDSLYAIKTNRSDHGGGGRGKGLKVPLLLECGHVFCSSCLQHLSKLHTSSLPCPTCTQPTYFRSGTLLIDQFPLSYHTFGLIAALSLGYKCLISFPLMELPSWDDSIQFDDTFDAALDLGCGVSEPSVKCEECDESSGILKCIKCDNILCQPCFDQIHSSKVLKSHKTVMLEENNSIEDHQVKERLQQAEIIAKSNCNKAMAELKIINEELKQLSIKLDPTPFTVWCEEAKCGIKYRDSIKWINEQTTKLHSQKVELHEYLSKIRTSLTKVKHVKLSDDVDKIIEDLVGGFNGMSTSQLPVISLPVVSLPVVSLPEEVPVVDVPVIDGVTNEDHTMECDEDKEGYDKFKEDNREIVTSSSEVEDSISITKKMSHLSDSNIDSSSSQDKSRSSHGSRISLMEMEQATSVKVCHVESPSEFYVQETNELDNLQYFNDLIKSYCITTRGEAKYETDVICGIYIRDEWKRGCILNVIWGKDSYANVGLIDYGNNEVVSLSHLFSLSDDIIQRPSFCSKCSLAGIQSITYSSPQTWRTNACSYLKAVTIGKDDLRMTVVSIDKDGVKEVYLYTPTSTGGLSINSEMILRGHAEKLSKSKKKKLSRKISTLSKFSCLPPPSVLSVDVTYKVDMVTATSPHLFYVQLDTASTCINDIVSIIYGLDVVQRPTSRSNADVLYSVDDLVLAEYSEMYYRAKITAVNNTTVKVQYIDYGNSATISKASLIPLTHKQLLSIPPQAHLCTLSDITWTDGNSFWPEPVCDRFHNESTRGALLMEVLGATTPIPVSLRPISKKTTFSAHLVHDGMAKYVKPLPVTTPLPDLPPVGFKGDAIVSSVISPQKFHLQMLKGYGYLRKLETEINLALPTGAPPSLSVDDYCIAHFHADHAYHRALVRMISDGGLYRVFFVDFGNEADVPMSSVGPLKEEWSFLSAQAIPCSLHGLRPAPPIWPLQHCLEFSNLVLDKEVTLIVKDIIPSTPPSVSVDIFIVPAGGTHPINVTDMLSFLNGPSIPPTLLSPTLLSPPLLSSGSSSSSSLNKSPPSFSSIKSPPSFSSIKSPPSFPSIKSPPSFPPLERSRGKRAKPYTSPSSYHPGVWPDNPFNAMITGISNSGRVYAQPTRYSEYFERLNKEIMDCVSVGFPVRSIKELSGGTCVLAKYDSDWYRGMVFKVEGEMVHVHFVDYGNDDIVKPSLIIKQLVAPDIPMLVLPIFQWDKSTDVLQGLIDETVTVARINHKVIKVTYKGQDLKDFLNKLQV